MIEKLKGQKAEEASRIWEEVESQARLDHVVSCKTLAQRSAGAVFLCSCGRQRGKVRELDQAHSTALNTQKHSSGE